MDYIKMSPYQETIWNVEQVSPGTSVSNIGGVILFEQDIEPKILLTVLKHIISTNAALRLRITTDGKLYQTEDFNLNLEEFDFSNLSKEELDKIINEWISSPFKIYDSALYEIKYIKLKNGHAGFLKLHHIICDGMSMVLICKQIEKYYDQYAEKQKNNFILSNNIDNRFINSLRNKNIFDDAKVREYFQIPTPSTWLLKGDKKKHNANSKKFIFHDDEKARLSDFCKTHNISIIATLYACMYIYISKIKSTKKVCVGRVLMNRSAENIDVIGMYVNTLPFYMDFSFFDIFIDICKIIDTQFREIYEFIDYPLTNIIDQTNNILFDIAISHRIEKVIPKIKDIKIIEYFCGACDLNLRIDVQEDKDSLALMFIYKTEAYSDIEIDFLFGRLKCILSQGINYTDVSDINILSKTDNMLIKNLNNTDFCINLDICNSFKNQVIEKPQATALIFNDKKFSYYHVDKKSNQIAYALQKKGILVNDIVGIMIKRSELLPIVMIAILKIGAAFLPISIEYPPSRKKSMLDICKIIVTEEYYSTKNCICLEDCNDNFDENVEVVEKKGKYAYLMYTSGTTGEPKAVMITMASLSCRLFWMHDKYKLEGCVLQKTPNIFDVSVWELLLPIIFGGTICLMNHGDEKFPNKIAEMIIKYNIDTVHFVPSMLSVFLEYIKDKHYLPSLKNVFSSGEILYPSTVHLFYKIFDNTNLYNLYGPTECTIDVTYYNCEKENVEIPIGKPVYNTKIYIVNDSQEIMPPLVPGEILVTGDLVSDGYFQTVSDKFIKFKGYNAYKTGDIGFLGADCNIYFLGRKDSQIKLRGKRLDLNEIENKILEIDGIQNVKVILKQNVIVAYYVSKKIMPSDITNFLKAQLPTFMIPPFIIPISQLPVTPTGKIDSDKLMKMILPTGRYSQPSNELEALLKAEILKYLELDDISTEHNFFDYGLDSLSVMQICVRLEKRSIPLNFNNFYNFPTIKQLASNIHKNEPFIFLKKADNKNNTLIIFFPHGGASAYAFHNVSQNLKNNVDVCGINMSFFNEYDENELILFLSSHIKKMEYSNIYLYSHCIGSWLAIKIAPHIECLKGIFIGGSLPTTISKKVLKKIVSPWDLMPDKMIKKYLNSINENESNFTKEFFKQFRTDTERFFNFMHTAIKVNISVPVILIFGDNDKITKNYKNNYKDWKKYIDANFEVIILENAKHDFISQKFQQLADILNKYLK